MKTARFRLFALAALAALASASAAAETAAFNLATFNVRCETPGDVGPLRFYRRMPRVAEIVRTHGFDVFGVQEMMPAEARILEFELPGFRRVGCGRNKNLSGETMAIFFRKDRFECLETETFWLSETPDEPGSKYPGAGCPRTCTWARLKDRRSGSVFLYLNTHLDHISSQARIDGVGVIFDRILKKAKAAGETIILTGDLNETLEATDDPAEIAKLAGPRLSCAAEKNPIALVSTELRDAYLSSETPHKGPAKTFHGWKGTPLARIDYVFTTPDVRVLSHETIDDRPEGGFASDHYPVAARLEPPAPGERGRTAEPR